MDVAQHDAVKPEPGCVLQTILECSSLGGSCIRGRMAGCGEVYQDLQKTFGVKTNAAVLRKALALANVASQYADADNTITITPGEGKPAVKVSLAG